MELTALPVVPQKNDGMTWFLICKMDITETDFLGLSED